MAVSLIDGSGSTQLKIETSAGRSYQIARPHGYGVGFNTGVLAAALAANASVFIMRMDSGSVVNAYIERLRLQWTTIAAFTTPVTAGRRLALFKGSSSANSSGGTTVTTSGVQKKHSDSPNSECDPVNGGIIHWSTTAALTVTGLTFNAEPIALASLAHLGAAGAYGEFLFEFAASENHPVVLKPGEFLAVRSPVAMDAGGTWQLAGSAHWHENTNL